MNRWMDGWTDGWMDGWMDDGWMGESKRQHFTPRSPRESAILLVLGNKAKGV